MPLSSSFVLPHGRHGNKYGNVTIQSIGKDQQSLDLAETYFHKYPNLVHDKNASYIWADLEIKGLAQHTNNGIVSMGFNGMSYNDNSHDKNNWSVLFSRDAYQAVFDWLQANRENIAEMQKFSTWQEV